MTGVILAGGASRRMGRDKAWLDWQGEPLLGHVERVMLSAFSQVVVAAGPGQDLPELRSTTAIVRDAIAHAGPLHGLAAALTIVAGPIFLIAVDTPRITREVALLIASQLGHADAAIPVVAGRRQPLLAAYSEKIIPIVAELVSAGASSMRALTDRLNVREVSEEQFASLDVFAPFNTPSDVAWLEPY